jgi:hypothetical protein
VNDGALDSEVATITIKINPLIYSTGHYDTFLAKPQKFWEKLSLPGATSLNVSVFGETARGFDFVEIFDADKNLLVPRQKFTGKLEENLSVAGDTLWLHFVFVDTARSFISPGINITIDPKPWLTNVNKISNKDSVTTFSAADFGEHLFEPTGNGLSRLKITSLPTHGVLKLNDRVVSKNQQVEASTLEQLTYTPDSDYTGIDSFNWNGSNGLEYAATPAQVSLLIQAFVTLNDQPMDLASAILQANEQPQSDPHKIRFSADITLVRKLPIIDTDIEFIGNGYTISGDNQHQILFVNSNFHQQ